MLTLAEVAEDPVVLTRHLALDDGSDVVFRPLVHGDAEGLAAFLGGLSGETRRMSPFDGYGLVAAKELCDAIARHDKLRLVVEDVVSGRIVGLVEFSFDVVAGDIARYREAGIGLGATDCRFGVTLADDHQGRGVGSRVFPSWRTSRAASAGRGSSCSAACSPRTRVPSGTTRRTGSGRSVASPGATGCGRWTWSWISTREPLPPPTVPGRLLKSPHGFDNG